MQSSLLYGGAIYRPRRVPLADYSKQQQLSSSKLLPIHQSLYVKPELLEKETGSSFYYVDKKRR